MADWQKWYAMAEDSLAAANRVVGDYPRVAASRYYYASYQAASAVLLYLRLTPPETREAWSHEQTPNLLVEKLNFIKSIRRQDVASRLRKLYAIRVIADYISEDEITTAAIERVRKDAMFVVRVCRDILGMEVVG